MTTAELTAAYHEKAIADANDLLATVGTVWQQCNDILRDQARGTNPLELRNVLVRLWGLACEATMRAMRPTTNDEGRR
jgi:hypothetical protein